MFDVFIDFKMNQELTPQPRLSGDLISPSEELPDEVIVTPELTSRERAAAYAQQQRAFVQQTEDTVRELRSRRGRRTIRQIQQIKADEQLVFIARQTAMQIDLLLENSERNRQTLRQVESLSVDQRDQISTAAQQSEDEAVHIGQLWHNVETTRITFQQLCSRRGRRSEEQRNNLETARQQVQTAEDTFGQELRRLEQREMNLQQVFYFVIYYYLLSPVLTLFKILYSFSKRLTMEITPINVCCIINNLIHNPYTLLSRLLKKMNLSIYPITRIFQHLLKTFFRKPLTAV